MLRHRPLREACAAFLVLVSTSLPARDFDTGRTLYVETCSKCHGLVTEHRAEARTTGHFLPVVALPLGPNLSSIYGRAAGAIEGFRYSNAFLKAAPGIVWNDETLDRWLTDSQAMIQGSYMFLKVEAPVRREIIGYLREFASHPSR